MSPVASSRLGRRTGWVTEHRRCPVHGGPLELWLDETDYASWKPARDGVPALWQHDDNRVGWRCDRCCGAWLENYFLSPPREVPRERLIVACTKCGSRRVEHTCVPACCGSHACLDCHATLDVIARLVEKGEREPVEPTRLLGSLVVSEGEPSEPSGVTRAFRSCPADATHGALELSFLDPVSDGQRPLGWRCSRCARSWSETWFRAWRLTFVADAEARVACPACRRTDVRPTDRGLRCERCDARLTLEITSKE